MSEIENLQRTVRNLQRDLQLMTMQRDRLQKRLDDALSAAMGSGPEKFKREFEAVRNDAIERVTDEDSTGNNQER